MAVQNFEKKKQVPGSQPQSSIWIGDAFWIVSGICLSVATLLVGTRILTSLLSPAEYGQLALSLSVATLALTLLGNPIGQTVIRFYLLCLRHGEYPVLFSFLKKSIFFSTTAILLAGGALFSFSFLSMEEGPSGAMIWLTTLFAIVLVATRVAIAIEDAVRERRYRAMGQSFFEFFRFFFAIALVTACGAVSGSEMALSGFVAAGGATLVLHLVFLKKIHFKASTFVKEAPRHSERPLFAPFMIPLFFSNGCLWIVMMAERWALQHWGSLTDVGGYTAVYQLAFMPMLFISNFFIVLTEPVIYALMGAEENMDAKHKTQRVNNLLALGMLVLSLLLAFLFFLFHHQIGSYILGGAFRSYSWIFPWLILAGGSFATAQQLLLKLNSEMRTRELAILWGGIAAVSLVLYIGGVSLLQLKGLLGAVVATNLLLLIGTLQLVWRPHAQ